MSSRSSPEKYGIIHHNKQTLIALYPQLVKLNYATISDEERKEAEMHYLCNEYEKGGSNPTVQVLVTSFNNELEISLKVWYSISSKIHS